MQICFSTPHERNYSVYTRSPCAYSAQRLLDYLGGIVILCFVTDIFRGFRDYRFQGQHPDRANTDGTRAIVVHSGLPE